MHVSFGQTIEATLAPDFEFLTEYFEALVGLAQITVDNCGFLIAVQVSSVGAFVQ